MAGGGAGAATIVPRRNRVTGRAARRKYCYKIRFSFYVRRLLARTLPRPTDRPVRSYDPPRNRPSQLRGGARLDCPLRGAGEEPGAHPHVPALAALAMERGGRRTRGSAHSNALDELSKYPVPQNVRFDVEDIVTRYGKLRLVRGADERLVLESDEAWLLEEISRLKAVEPCLDAPIDARSLAVKPGRARHAQAGADQGRLSGRRPGRLRRWCAAHDRASQRHDRRPAIPPAPLPRGGGASLPRRRLEPRRLRG